MLNVAHEFGSLDLRDFMVFVGLLMHILWYDLSLDGGYCASWPSQFPEGIDRYYIKPILTWLWYCRWLSILLCVQDILRLYVCASSGCPAWGFVSFSGHIAIIFRCVHQIVKSNWLHHVWPSVFTRLSVWYSMAPTGWIFINFDI